jgi:hypothetical protein
MMMDRDDTWLDRVAITLSGLCLLHCLIGLALLALLSMSGGLLSHDVHVIGLLLALPLAAVAFWRGQQRHGRLAVGLLGLAGIIVMLASLFVDHGALMELLVSMAGVALLAAAHLWNLTARPS